MELRDYQQECIREIESSNYRKQLIVLPTGVGKTIIFAYYILKRGCRVLVLVHTEELVYQTRDKILMIDPTADVGIVKAEYNEPDRKIVVGSVPTLRGKRLEEFAKEQDFEIIVTDEAHHANAISYQNIYETLGVDNVASKRKHLGFTATPMRSDEQSLLDVFEGVSFQRSILDFIPRYLAPLKIEVIESAVSIDGVRAGPNDLNCNELSEILNTRRCFEEVLRTYLEKAKDRRSTLIFCANIEHSRALAAFFNSKGVPAGFVDSMMYEVGFDRAETLEKFKSGELKVLTNCAVLTEGCDMPEIDCIFLLKPHKHLGSLIQQVGRGTRKSPETDKKDCIVFFLK